MQRSSRSFAVLGPLSLFGLLVLAACEPVKASHDGGPDTVDGGSGLDAGSDAGLRCGNGSRDPGEACDQTDLGGKGCQDQGFPGGDLGCTASCTFDTTACLVPPDCGNGVIDGSETCDGALLGGATCASEGFFAGTLVCGGGCQLDRSACTHCGDGDVDLDSDEACDLADLDMMTCGSLPGFQSGNLACTADCRFNTSGCIACGDGVAEGAEACDGVDLGGDSCTTIGQGFVGGTLACQAGACSFDTSACTAPPTCPNGMIDGGEQCDGANLNGGSCGSATGGLLPSGSLACTGGCQYDTASCYQCGDAKLDGAEVCDGLNFGGQTCVGKGHDGGSLACAGNCLSISETSCSDCGDVLIEGLEQCDTTNLGGQTCTTLGNYEQGTPACTSACTFNLDGCIHCGDGVAEGTELCDAADLKGKTCSNIGMGFTGGTLKCGAGCGYDTSGCLSPPTCPDGDIDSGEQCDGGNLNGATCSTATMGARPSGALSCTSGCTFDTTACYKCGDGALNGAEVCDGSNLAGQTCVAKGHDGGTLACAGTCLGFVETACSDCGDGTLESPEPCDGALLGGQSCPTQGAFSGGTLACNGTCSAFSTAGCFGAPTVPVLARPLNGAYVGSSLVAGTRRPKFAWRAATVSGGTAIRYDLQYASDKTFAAAVTTVASLTTLEHQPTGDLAISTALPKGTRYYWRVRACAGNACSAYSAAYLLNLGRNPHDLNGDGYAEVVLNSRLYDVNGKASVGLTTIAFGPALAVASNQYLNGTTTNEGLDMTYEVGDFNGDGYADLVVGAPNNDAAAGNAGSVAVYLGGAVFNTTPDWQVFGFANSDLLAEVAVGDVNGDGFDDLAIGAPKYDAPGQTDGGRVDVYLGGANFDTTADRTYLGTTTETLGYGLGIADLNGDGFDDLGLPVCALADGFCTNNTLRVYPGSAAGSSASVGSTVSGISYAEGVGDVNADGYEDLVGWQVFCSLFSCGFGVQIIHGAPSGQVNPLVSLKTPAGYGGTQFGGARQGVGDVNRDGFDDVVVGDYSQTGGGGWWLYLGGAGTMNDTADLTYAGLGSSGNAVCGGADINGDAIADWFDGAPATEVGSVQYGGAHVFYGANTTPNSVADLTLTGDQPQAGFGWVCGL